MNSATVASVAEAPRGHVASRSQRAIRAYQGDRHRVPRAQATGDLGGHEEGTRRRFEECRAGMAADHRARACALHDFPGDAVGKAIPYGVYDMARNEAWVSVGRDHDTPAFAVASIRQWWTMRGRWAYPHATSLLITADAGGSNAYRTRAGRRVSNGWPTISGCAFMLRIFRRGPASGTRSSIGSSRIEHVAPYTIGIGIMPVEARRLCPAPLRSS